MLDLLVKNGLTYVDGVFKKDFGSITMNIPCLDNRFLAKRQRLFELAGQVYDRNYISFPVDAHIVQTVSLSESFASVFEITHIFSMPYYLHGIYLTEADFDGGPVRQCRLMWTCFSFHSFFRYIFIRHSASNSSFSFTSAVIRVISNTS